MLSCFARILLKEGKKIICGSIGVKYVWVDSRKSQVFVLQAELVIVFLAKAFSDNESITVVLRCWNLHYLSEVLVPWLNYTVSLPC